MAFTPKNTVVNRHENLNYAIWNGIEKPVLAGTGITDWTEDASPNTDDGQYINEKNQHSNMTGYAPSVSYSGELKNSQRTSPSMRSSHPIQDLVKAAVRSRWKERLHRRVTVCMVNTILLMEHSRKASMTIRLVPLKR